MRQNNTVMIYLQGMSCTLCAKRIEDCLGALQGVSEVRVDFGKRIALVRYSSEALTPEDLCRAVETAGKLLYLAFGCWALLRTVPSFRVRNGT